MEHGINHQRQLPISAYQKRFFFEWALAPDENSYNVSCVHRITGALDKKALMDACEVFIRNHDVMHAQYSQNGEACYYGDFGIADFYHELVFDAERPIESQIGEYLYAPFDLTKGPILRLYLLKGDDKSKPEYYFFYVAHHIIWDSVVALQFCSQISNAYNGIVDGNKPSLIVDKSFGQAVEAVENTLDTRYKDKAQQFWMDFIGDLSLHTDLPYRSDVAVTNLDNQLSDKTGEFIFFDLSISQSSGLRAYAKEQGTTLFIVLSSLYALVLSKYINQRKFFISYPINARPVHFEGVPGCFTNNIPMKLELDMADTLSQLIRGLGKQRKTVKHYLRYSLMDIIHDQRKYSPNETNNAFNVTFAHTYLNVVPFELENLKTTPLDFTWSTNSTYEVGLLYDDDLEIMKFKLEYRKSLFDKDLIDRLISSLKKAIGDLVTGKEILIRDYSVLTREADQQMVYDWNRTDKPYSKDKTIHELFMEQAAKTPDHIALVYEGAELSYKELDERSNQLARHIRSQYTLRTKAAMSPDTLIGLCLDRSLEMVVGILGVLKAGGAYVPIDPGYPQDRIDYLLEDTGAELVLSQGELDVQLPEEQVVYIDLEGELYREEDSSTLPVYSSSTDLAYVIYTSGTTGKPKGVMIEHSGIVNRLEWMQSRYPLHVQDVVLQKTPYVFDVSVWELLWANWYGGTIVLAKPEGHKDTEYLQQLIQEKRITKLHFVPGMLEAYNHYLREQKLKFPISLREVFCSGEALSEAVVTHTYENGSQQDFQVHNLYGPTEASIDVTFFETSAKGKVYIGKPISNTRVYVLDEYLNPVPVGVIGELYIGGAGLSRGYLNRAELTAERFIANPFATEEDKRQGYTKLYKTGDQVRWLADGNLEYLGRNDDQVKIRGYRIELGEVEHALSQVSGIRQSCVLVRERETESGTIKYLAGYYVGEEAPSKERILEALSEILPEYMVPGSLTSLERFPLTLNGKLDKRALPDPELGSSGEDYVAPRTALEETVCGIWGEVLGVSASEIGIHQNFFRIGGNSVLSIRLKHKLNQLPAFADMGIADLFKYNTIAGLIGMSGQDKETSYKLQGKSSGSGDHEIAIIGISGAFSGADSVTALWDLLAGQQEGIRFYDEEECRGLGVPESLLQNPDYVAVSGKVGGIELFDPKFWGLSPKESGELNPQIRKFIEHSWFVLESSGYAHERREQNIGVFAGSGDDDYLYRHIVHGAQADHVNLWEALSSNSKDALATKTAFLLGLTGPANSINTACSTGLVAVVEACYKLRWGICDMALAGGVSFSMPGDIGYIYEEGMIASRDGHCRTFDQSASGTTGGSGVGVVLLKRVADAVKDGDPILGVIKGYASNNDGDRKTGYTAPSVIGQSECIINAQRMAGVTSDQIDYVECHGTGTHLGDPIEVQALKEAFAYNQSVVKGDVSKTVLGSVKANIGHTNSAAGTAGLIKVCAMLSNQQMPGQVNFEVPNAELQLEESPFEIIKGNRSWPAEIGKQRLAGVSSFGIGGTNAHVIIGDYMGAMVDAATEPLSDGSRYIIPISAKSKSSLDGYRQALLSACVDEPGLSLRDVSYTLQERREAFSYRSAYSAGSIPELISKLNADTGYGQANMEERNKVVFMFPGQGSQYMAMASGLYEDAPFFKAEVDRCILLANAHLEIDLYGVLYPEGGLPLYDINETQWSQISLFIIEYALAKYVESLGVKADAFIGHSIGEYVAATLSGVFTIADAIKIVISRGRLMQSMEPGKMLAINAREGDIKSIVEENNCEIAVINSAEDVVASGSAGDIDMLQKALESQSIPTIELMTSHAYHSRLMEVAAREFKAAFKGIQLNKPVKTFISNLSGESATGAVSTPDYWSRQLRSRVEFSKGINTLIEKYNHRVTFVELGPGKGLGYFVNKHKNAKGYKELHISQLLPSAKEAKDTKSYQTGNKEDLKARLWMSGLIQKPNEDGQFKQAKLLHRLPGYQFDHQRCWLEKGEKGIAPANGLKLLPKEKWLSAPIWSAICNLDTQVKINKAVFKSGLIILRKDQLDSLDFASLVQDIQFIVLDEDESVTSNMGSSLIRVNPGNEHHFEELAKQLKGRMFDVIIHAASVNNVANLNDALDNSFYSLFLVRQHLINYSENLLILTNRLAQITNEDIIHPSNGTLIGATRNINHEFLRTDARVIDIGFNQENIISGVAQVWAQKSYHKSEELLAIRFGKLWAERFEAIAAPVIEKSNIEDGDVILITGGLGGVGLAIAEHIASHYKATLILTSRKNIFDDKSGSASKAYKKHIVERIIAGGSIVDMQYADISVKAEAAALTERISKTYGKLTGIIHTAGVVPLEANKYSLKNIKEAFKGKVFGIDNIINTAELNQVKFIACTSSLASIMGDVNRIDYCGSNSYLDYLSADKLKFKNIKLLSTNWNGWLNKGAENNLLQYQYEGTAPVKDLNKLMYVNGASHEENAELFCRLINQSGYGQVIISKLDISSLKKELFGQDSSLIAPSRTVLQEANLSATAYQVGQIFGDLLGMDQISIHDDFFRIGGNSILAIRLSHQLSKVLGREISVADVFKHKTIGQLLEHGLGEAEIIIPETSEKTTVLSFAQERLWFIEEYEQGTNAYHVPGVYELASETDKEGISYAIRSIVERHEVLRSTISHGEDDRGIQVVHDRPVGIREVLIGEGEDYEVMIREDINRPFDLAAEYPIRVVFYTIADSGRRLLLINTHHIASDGWSMEIFQRELSSYYEAYVNKDQGFSLPALPIQYKDYAIWQRSYLTGEVLTQQLSYWKEKLSGYQTLNLPADYVRPAQIDYRGRHEMFRLSEATSERLRALGKAYGVTLHSVLLSGLSILLGKYTGQEDIVTGSPTANRQYRQTEGLIGFFVNTQVNRTRLGKGQSYSELMREVHQEQVQAQMYQDLPFERLVDELEIERDLSRHPVFQVMFVVQSFGSRNQDRSARQNYLNPLRWTESPYEVEKFDLSVFMDDSVEAIGGTFSYATGLFRKETIIRLIGYYTNLLDQLAASPDVPYGELSLLTAESHQQVVYDWNQTDKPYSKDKTIHELFMEQAAKTPDHIALVYENRELSYKELDERSNQLARHIRSQYTLRTKAAMSPDTLIGLLLDRSLEMVVGILGVLKAGGAYVPIDPGYPQDRIDYLLEDTGAELVLSQGVLGVQLPEEQVVYIDLEGELYRDEDSSTLPVYSSSTDLAYVIYTSGTTGKPKGVMVEHKGVNNLIQSQIDFFDVRNGDTVIQFASYVFDASVSEIFTAFMQGARLIVVPDGVRQDADLIGEYLSTHRINIATLPPVLLSAMSYQDFSDLKTIVVAGESSSMSLMHQWSKGRRLINAYGPTEGTVCASMHRYESGDLNTNIGKPISNTRVYVLDEYLHPVPVGVIGELYIGGAGLSRGYLNRAELTAERFISNPFATEEDKRQGYTKLYKTGDQVRWLADGNLEYLGRNDDQVKLRGYRIELGEVEQAMLQVSGIRQSCVLVRERETESGAIKYLAGYYVGEEAPSKERILEALSEILPEYMVPGSLTSLERFPLTLNGKLDKRALPDPELGSSGEDYVAPRTALEETVCGIWGEVLGVSASEIGIHQNFFRIGGNSVLSIRLKHKLNQLPAFADMGIADLFKYNTIAGLIGMSGQDKETSYKLQGKSSGSGDHEIAIIGISGAFSGADSVTALWDLLAGQQEGIRFYDEEECRGLGVPESLLQNPDYVAVSGKVGGIELFDPKFWGLSPKESGELNPQIRKFIEHSWFVLESSGYAHERREQNIGVFAGSGDDDYLYRHIVHGAQADHVNLWEALSSNSKDALATKTAFLLGLTGPANSINTACSTGLVAVVEACYKLRWGICDMALAGGVSFSMPGDIGYIYEEGMIASRDGHCRTFDQSASGTTGGSGVGVVLLKRVADAVKDGDPILGVIKGYASNNDGDRKTGYTAPSVIGQSECIINAQRMAGVTSDQIDYVECHGTGTHLGDPIEVQALKEAFAYNQSVVKGDVSKTVLGSVKANIGHTNSAAGTAGLIKVCAMLSNQQMPGQVNFEVPNAELQLEESPFEIIKGNRSWPAEIGKQRLAGVSSFGIGGTNAHVIIGDYMGAMVDAATEPLSDGSRYIIPISAKSKSSLDGYRQALLSACVDEPGLSLRDVSYTLQERREAFSYRSAYSAGSIPELISKLNADTGYGQANMEERNKVVFMFPGQGSQYMAMASGLYEDAPFFKAEVDRCILLANAHLEIDLYGVLYPEGGLPLYDINEIQWSQISLFIIEYALAKYVESLGVKADAFIGHSFGEYVAATLSGVFSLADGIRLVISRGQLMQSMEPGKMLAINAGESKIRSLAEAHQCEIAVINSAEDVVVSGRAEDIELLLGVLEKQEIAAIKVNGSVAGHSRLMEVAAGEFEASFKGIRIHKPVKEFISNISGDLAGEEVMRGDYWSRQLRSRVEFSKGINTLIEKYNHRVTFVELGPGKGLGYFVNKHKNAKGYKELHISQLLPSAKEAKDTKSYQTGNKEDLKARLWMSGLIQKPNEDGQFKQAKLLHRLPGYQFDHQRCWLEKGEKGIECPSSIDDIFYERSWERKNFKSTIKDIEGIKHKHILLLINDSNIEQSGSARLLKILSERCDNIRYVINKQTNNIQSESKFDFGNELHIGAILDEQVSQAPLDIIIYVSPSIDLDNACLDIYAVRNIFAWSKNSEHKILKFISVSFDNFDVLGDEQLREKPSIIPGITKSIPFEYFNSGTKAIHIDLSAAGNYISPLLRTLQQDIEKDLIVIRGKYEWIPTYKHIKIVQDRQKSKDNTGHEAVFLITGGLGALGYAYANYTAQNEKKCTIILIGRTIESDLKEETQIKLFNLRKTKHQIIYSTIDISHKDASDKLKELLISNHITTIDVLLHTAVIVAKSALFEKTQEDIDQVISTKIKGVENLVKLSGSIPINNLISCSSLASILPSLGNMEYTAANLYLDEISHRSHPHIRQMLSININQVSDAGAAVKSIAESTSKSGRTSDAILSGEFPGIVEKLLQVKATGNIGLSRYDLNTGISKNRKSLDHQEETGHESHVTITEDHYTATAYQVGQIFGDLLGMDQISIHDNFFRIGGNSILAIRLSHQLSKVLGHEISVADVFKHKTIGQLLKHSLGRVEIIIPATEEKASVLSFAQERLWFIEEYEQGTNAYHMPGVYELASETDKEGISYAIRSIVERHEVLRSTISHGEDDRGIQVVHDRPVGIREVLIGEGEDYEVMIREDINRPFDLSREYPIRVVFYTIADSGRRLLLINTHHIASDGWSMEIFQRELSSYYEAYVNKDQGFSLPALPIQYKDYAIWQRSYLTGEVLTQQLSYWKEKLSGYQTLNLPADYVRPAQIDYRGRHEMFRLSEATSERLRALGKAYGVTLHSVLLSGLSILLGKYTGQDDIVTGSPTANRQYRQTEGLIGFFVNTQVNRTRLGKGQSYSELMREVHQAQVQAQMYQDLPFERLVDELEIERDLSRHPVFQVMFALQSFGRKVSPGQKGYLNPLRWTESPYEVEKFDLSIFMDDSVEAIGGTFSYATGLFRKETIIRLIGYYTHLLDQLAASPDVPYGELSLLSAESYQQIVYDWNQTDKPYSKDKTIHELFMEQAAKTPDHIALVYEGAELSYKELDERSNQLARHIRSQYTLRTKAAMSPDTLIGLCLDRSLEMVVGILGVLKAGGAYVPIDPGYPQDRIDYLLEDTGAELVLSQGELGVQLPEEQVVYIDLEGELYRDEDSSTLPVYSSSTDLAYVIYTSGTTGKPKGVMVEHRGVNNLVFVQQNLVEINAESKILLFASLVFDASVWEIFSGLLSGATLFVLSSMIRQNADLVSEYMAKSKITITLLPPALLNMMSPVQLGEVKTLLVGGESSSMSLMHQWSKGRRLINAYGPTEGTVCASMHRYESGDLNTNIGKPINNARVYVLDEYLHPVPVGVIGELYIGGAGLSRGYLNRAELTAERFISNPFATEEDKRQGYTKLYKTGDQVRWLADGNLEYLGRNDDQVKLRGYRIELGEVEQAMLQVSGIRQSCVLVRERETESGAIKYLAGYYVGDDRAPDEASILEALSRVLPDYMVPGSLTSLDRFPLTVNGKLDKGALPDPEFGSSAEDYTAPVTELEQALCVIWKKLLNVERVGISDDFFRIGGNSILAIRLSHQLSKALGREISVADVFKHKTIGQLLEHGLGESEQVIPVTSEKASRLSFAQERLWFIEEFEQGTNAYHIPAVYELASETDKEGISYAIRSIAERHEVLRSTIEQGEDNRGIQVVHGWPLPIGEVIIEEGEDYEVMIRDEINRPFDLAAEYPIRVVFYELSESGRRLLLINTHHIASDGWSMEIFHRELSAYYEAYINKDSGFSLPGLPIQYKDYALWQRSYLSGDVLTEQLSYWKEKLGGHQTLNLPTDHARPALIGYRGARETFTLSEVTSERLRALGKAYGVTLHSVLLSGLSILLGKYTGQDDIVTGSPTANRQYRQTEDLIGFFVNPQVNRTRLGKGQSYSDLMREVHQAQVQAQKYQDLPFEKLVDELEVARDPSRHPLFQVLFVVQSFSDNTSPEQKAYFQPVQGTEAYAVEKLDLSVYMDDSGEAINGLFSYATGLFRRETIIRLIGYYTHLLDQLAASPDVPYGELSLLTAESHQQVVYDWNQTDKPYSKDKTIHELFMEQAAKTPDHIALVYENRELSYKELDERSNQLARHIRSQYTLRTKAAMSPDTLIGLLLDRSLEMVVGILGVLKAGGAYVPIDPGYPQDRIDYLLEDTGAELVLSQGVLGVQLPEEQVVYIDLEGELYRDEDSSTLPVYSSSTDLAYVIYTSGTTGKPKGVMVEHKGVNNLIQSQIDFFDVRNGDTVIQFASYVFDASVSEIFTAFMQGARLIVVPDGVRQDADLIGEYLSTHRINIATLPPVLLSAMSYQDFSDLKTIVVAGESSSMSLMHQWSKGRRLINAYGPTEGTVCASMHRYESGDLNTNIGKPISNTRVYVLDEYLHPVPVGVIGELYIGGAGLSRGYLNRAELTAERFISNPFATEEDKRQGYTKLYKTGDQVRWLADGNLEYLGRNDDQVKLRGYRIELGEVEQAMLQVSGIRQSCVLVRERETESGTIKYLAGYYVVDGNYTASNDSAILDSWEGLYDTEYEKRIDEKEITSDFSGWNSYVTGMAFPLREMELWRTAILDIIRNLSPVHILEIGVGSGLLMYPLLKTVQQYTGLDISQAVINRHAEYLKEESYNVALYHLKADELDELPAGELYDTIIVNSVCQYFPGIGYFNLMLEKAIDRLSETGSIFLGDIRNYDLHKSLIGEKLAYQGEAPTPQAMERISIKETELLISPGYFHTLKSRYENIRVEIHERGDGYQNELSKYRYDVVISGTGKIMKRDWDKAERSDQYHNIPFLNQLSKEAIISALSEILPDYMVPGSLTSLDRFPLTLNGKLDKRALPDPELGSSAEDYVAPVTDLEDQLCGIWAELLCLERISIEDDFFSIGGDSILSIQLTSRIRQSGFKCQVEDVFSCRTIAKLSKQLIENAKASAGVIKSEQGLLRGSFELLPVQEWFTGRISELVVPDHYNQSFLVKVPELETGKLSSIIGDLVAYHDVLRVRYIKKEGGWQQSYQASIAIPELKVLDVKDHPSSALHSILTEWQSRFNVEQGPLFQVGYLYGYGDGSARIYFALHHLIVDSVSWRILAEDIKALYAGHSLPLKGSSYRQWVSAVKAYPEQHPEERSYWESQLSGLPKYAIAGAELSEPCSGTLELSKTLTGALLQKASGAYHTEINDLLLTALAYALKDINGHTVQGITLEGHGREAIDPSVDHSHTVGWFTSMYPVKLELRATVRESIQGIKESLRSIPEKGIGFGSFATEKDSSYSHGDLPGIVFNYLGQFDTHEEGYWHLVSEDSGSSIHGSNADRSEISINGLVSNGKLRFSIVSRLGEESATKLSSGLKGHLTAIISHCEEKLEKEGSSYTPSDFSTVQLSQSLLDKL